jgi:protein-tyrosine phosphatase
VKYAIVFSLLATVLVVNAFWAESWLAVALLGWAGASMGLVAAAYWLNAPGIFGKRPDGRIARLNRLALLPYGLLAHSVWLLSSRLSKEPAWQRIDERLVVGRRLLSSEVPGDFDAVLDLTCEFQETPRLRQSNYTCLPMLDASAIEVAAIANAVEKAAASPGTLFVHCAQGHGRTGLIAALVLAKRTPGLTPREALARLQAIRPGIGLSRQQLAVLDALQAAEAMGKPWA